MDIIRKIEQLVVEFPGLGECLELTLKKAFPIIKQVTAISVKRVDGNLLNRVLVREEYDEYNKRHSARNQEIWALVEGDAILVDIKKSVVESSPGRFVRELGETVGSRLVALNRIQYLVLTDEVYDWDNKATELNVTVYKPAKGSTIAEDVAWEQHYSELENERIDSGYYDAGDEEDPPEPTEVNVGGHPGSWVIFE